MKKVSIYFCVIALFVVFLLSPVSASTIEANQKAENIAQSFANKNLFSITMAINEEIVIANGAQVEITAPVLVFDKTYVDLYAVAPLLDINVEWIQDYIGFFRVTINENTIDFTLISQWDDLINQKYKFFVKDSKIFVSLRELAELFNYDVAYNDGIITIGNPVNNYTQIYHGVCVSHLNDYIYTTYPCWAEYVVNPYLAYSYETMINDANRLQHMYPELVKITSIGKSVEDRDLILIEFGRGPQKIFVCGTHHAREYIATTYLLYAIDRYAYAYRTDSMWGQYSPKEILDNVTFCIVPMVNPDGVNLVQKGIGATSYSNEIADMKIYEGAQYGHSAWKANIHGVDVNWNYNKDWSLYRNKNQRGSTGFNGDYPCSEPETKAVSNYVDAHSFEAFLSFHTQGQIFYWADDNEQIYKAIKNDTGFVGYKDDGAGMGGSFFDYVYRNFNKPTITVELCPYIGNFPYPDSDFDTVWTPAKNILLIVGNEIIYKNNLN